MGDVKRNKDTAKSEVSEWVIPPPGEPKGASIPSDAQNSLNVAFRYIAYLNPLTIRKKGRRAKAYFALAIVCFFWGTTWLASRQAVIHVPSALQIAGLRQLLGGLCYVIFFLAKGATWPRRKEWGFIFVLSLLNFGLSNALSMGRKVYFGRIGFHHRFYIPVMACDHWFIFC